MPVVHIGEIVESLRKTPSKQEQVAILRKHATNAPFRLLLNYIFDPEVKFFDFKGELPDYKGLRSNVGYGRGISLYSQVRQIPMFILHPSRNYPFDRMFNLYRRIMENLPGIEGEIFTAVLNNEVPEGLDLETVIEAYPEDARFRPVVPVQEVSPAPEFPVAPTVAAPVEAEPVSVPVEAPPAYQEGTLQESLTLVSTGNIVPANVTQPVTPTLPVKRGRGRPPKNPPTGAN